MSIWDFLLSSPVKGKSKGCLCQQFLAVTPKKAQGEMSWFLSEKVQEEMSWFTALNFARYG